MFYEVQTRRSEIDATGANKEVTEKYIVKDCELFANAEYKSIEYITPYSNGLCDVTAMKQSKIREFINAKNEESEQGIYVATVADVFIDDNGKEKEIKYVVAIWATSVGEANELVGEYLKQGMEDFRIIGVKRTKFVDLI